MGPAFAEVPRPEVLSRMRRLTLTTLALSLALGPLAGCEDTTTDSGTNADGSTGVDVLGRDAEAPGLDVGEADPDGGAPTPDAETGDAAPLGEDATTPADADVPDTGPYDGGFPRVFARADMLDFEGNAFATVNMLQSPPGPVEITFRYTSNLPTPPAGPHALRVMSGTVCEAPDFTTAGMDFDPLMTNRHADPLLGGQQHAGDLGDAVIPERGRRPSELSTIFFTLEPGLPTSVEGQALVLFALPENWATGDSGARIACGILVRL